MRWAFLYGLLTKVNSLDFKEVDSILKKLQSAGGLYDIRRKGCKSMYDTGCLLMKISEIENELIEVGKKLKQLKQILDECEQKGNIDQHINNVSISSKQTIRVSVKAPKITANKSYLKLKKENEMIIKS